MQPSAFLDVPPPPPEDEEPVEDPPVAVTGVTLDADKTVVYDVETVTLTVTIEPEDAANQNYSVTGPAGVIIVGTSVTFEDSITDTTTTATLTVTTEDGEFTASVDLEVWDNALDRDLIGSWSSDGGTTKK